MFKTFSNAWKIKDIRSRLLYVLLLLVIYRLGAHIALPGINPTLLLEAKGATNPAQSLYALVAGGGFGSIFAMGIGPYITASIIMQLLTVAIPRLEQLQKEGEDGRKKINQYTRVLSVALALLQGGATVYGLRYLFFHQNWLVYIMATISMVTGTIFIMWLAELLTEKAIGHGSSFIIFANILSGIPGAIINFYNYGSGSGIWNWIKIAIILVLFIGLIALTVFVQDGERRIPVQYSKKMVGRQMVGGQSSYIPLKVNIAGVMSIIFAISLLQTPTFIGQFFQSEKLQNVIRILSISQPLGAILYIVLIFLFTFFYISFAVNPIEMAENMKKSGGFIPGIRPGKPTSDYIQRTIDRLSWLGAFFYAFIAMVPVFIQWIFGISVGIGGTTLLIVTGVALEVSKQLESQLLMRHYKGFLG